LARGFATAVGMGLPCLVSCAANCKPGKNTLNTRQ
jgi:hypothetical protein